MFKKKDEDSVEEEILDLVEEGHEQGLIEEDEAEMISNILDLGDKIVRDIMTSRNKIFAVPKEAKLSDIIETCLESGYSRYPVYDEDGEHFAGLINVKDLISMEDKDREHFCVQDILREISYTYEGKHLSELFREMKKKRESIMAVLDEYGDLSGIVTIEDILEELVGDIRDEYDEDEELEIVQISDHQYEVQGYLSLDDINEKIGTDFESEDYDSIGGLLIEHLERLPEIGDSVQVGNCTLTAKDVDKNVIKLVDITLHESGLN